MCKNVFSVFQSLSHFSIVRLKSQVKRQSLPLSFLIHISHKSAFRIQQNLRMVLEINLHNLIWQSEHNCMFCPHPFLNIDWAWLLGWLERAWDWLWRTHEFFQVAWVWSALVAFKVRSKVLQKSYFLLQIFGVLSKIISCHDILLFSVWNCFSFIIIEGMAVGVYYYLRGIIEEDSCGLVWEEIT